ncbi:hypothetical protein CS063_02385 [Sporanaerobium hydrogeniformans]|uniref:Uncharacterized protein n=1 Tax=Sporanaerobium hydrogeniformans TaxID=3072179 RepID=A0AC61DG81_9FIRM|nr:hypothetical protein [Sporanaerobium hydrogeniformans]PHV72345.1 hypothetical protein CS063_02385 [Sporanaerobium hydrogeniformans]
MKRRLGIVMMLSLGSLVGCTSVQRTPFPTFSNLAPIEVEKKEKDELINEKQLQTFFSNYLSLSEEGMLLMNVQPQLGDEDYEEYFRLYREKLKNLLGEQLASSAKEKLKEAYRTYDFHLPKKLSINGYVTYGPAKVEQVEILATRFVEDSILYKVAVTTEHSVENLAAANSNYRWDESKGYYVQNKEPTQGENTFHSDKEDRGGLEESFYYLQETPEDTEDAIKLIEYYWVKVEQGESLKVESIKEGSPINVNEKKRQLATNTKHVKRIAYNEQASSKELEMIKKVFTKLFSQPKEFYTYYSELLSTHDVALKDVWWNQLDLSKEVLIPKKQSKDAFNGVINPYKDNLKSIAVDREQLVVKPSIYGTKKQPRFRVFIPAKGVDIDDNQLYYLFEYYVGMEQGKIEYIYYVKRSELSEEDYGKVIQGEEITLE